MLKKLKLELIEENHSVFILKNRKLIIIFYMNHIQYFNELLNRILQVEKKFKTEFEMTNMGESNYYLKINMDYKREYGTCFLH
jgi:hypothetical protein